MKIVSILRSKIKTVFAMPSSPQNEGIRVLYRDTLLTSNSLLIK